MSSAFMMLLLEELSEDWTLELANPDDWDDGDALDTDDDARPDCR